MTTVLAAVKDRPAPGITIRRVEVTAHDDDVLLRPLAVGICGSDISSYRWTQGRIGRMQAALPVVLGHEIVADVVDVGTRAESAPGHAALHRGMRVVVDPIVSCGRCRTCGSGRRNLCYRRRVVGLDIPGGMAELAAVPGSSVVPLPVPIDPVEATLVEPLATAVQAIEAVGLVLGDECAVVGPGPLGILLGQALRVAGARVTVLGTPRSHHRLQVAERLGADEALVADDDWIAANSDRFEVVFDVGGPTALLTAVRLVRRGGRVVYASGFDDPVPIAFNSMMKHRGVTLHTSTGHELSAWQRAFSLVRSSEVSLRQMVDTVTPLHRADEAFQAAAERTAVKCVVRCTGEES